MEWSSPRTSRSTRSKPKNAKQLKTSANFYSSNDHDTGLYVTESILGFFPQEITVSYSLVKKMPNQQRMARIPVPRGIRIVKRYH